MAGREHFGIPRLHVLSGAIVSTPRKCHRDTAGRGEVHAPRLALTFGISRADVYDVRPGVKDESELAAYRHRGLER
jgi:hypothetical protein